MNGSCAWVIVNDPLDVGAFKKDAIFSGEDVANMLRQRTFTLGTLLSHRKYGEFTVIHPTPGGNFYRLEGPGHMAFPSSGQRLIVSRRFV